ncbi:MAG: hypothetical protein U0531_19605 [Dehalococcoidia bacterium]
MEAGAGARGDHARGSVHTGHLIDFHVHTPVSRCYGEDGVGAADIVRAAVAAGLDAMVVCDHHSPAALDDVRAAAQGTGVAVFPSMEITTAQGHLLALFDPPTRCGTLRDLLADLSVPDHHHGNGSHVIGPAMADVIDAVTAAGGLAIPAHVDRWPNGFLEAPSDLRTRRAIHEHEHIVAIEITLPATQAAWQAGATPGYRRPLACVQGSDAHATYEVGRRPTLVATHDLTVAGLRTAFRRVGGVTTLAAPASLGRR